MEFLKSIMMDALNVFFSFSGNWGVSIILLTLAVKLILYPINSKSVKSMLAMQKLQPKVEALQKKHKDEPQIAQKEMLELYKQEGVNPLGGCLPMLLQIPIFFALFFTLSDPKFISILVAAKEHAQFLWISNLSKPDPTYVFVTLIGLSTYWSSLTMPGGAKQQKAMLYFMPAFIAIISVSFPAGVQLYWIVQNVFTIAQQILVTRK